VRLTSNQLNAIKEKLGVDTLWSYSKVSTYINCPWEYKLKYIDKIKVKSDNCYTWWGTISHDLVQGMYDKKYSYEDMARLLEDKVLEFNLIDDPSLKFPNDDQYKNYVDNLRHYFSNVKKLPYNFENEKAVLAIFEGLEKYVFQGYIDSLYKDENGNYYIQDYKTSSISGFTGKKLDEKSAQLKIYAIGLNQFHKIPLEKIYLRFDMMKYCIVSYPQKNGNIKETKAERRIWVAKIANQLRKDLMDVEKEIEKKEKDIAKLEKKINMKKTTESEVTEYKKMISYIEGQCMDLKEHVYDPITLNEMIEDAISRNSLDKMPRFIQDKYTVSDCYIDIQMNEEIAEQFKKELISILDEITIKSQAEDLDEAFGVGKIDERKSFYCNNLCELRHMCVFYKEYKENSEMFLTNGNNKTDTPSDEELLKMLGL
jgi:PD-(D/E)XK nuclease superfamily